MEMATRIFDRLAAENGALMEDTFAQVPALLVTLPAIGWICWSGDYGTFAAIAYTAIIFVSAVHMTELDRLKGYEVGAVDYMPVPVQRLDLGRSSDRIVGRESAAQWGFKNLDALWTDLPLPRT